MVESRPLNHKKVVRIKKNLLMEYSRKSRDSKSEKKGKKIRVMLASLNWPQFSVTTRHVANCDSQRCVSRPYGDTTLPITTRHVASCGTKLCLIR